MKAPEEIALIGGGILLSSGLVFGVKSGAATTIPKVSHSVDTVLQGKKNADSSSGNADSSNPRSAQQKQAFANSFEGKYQQAQQKHWQTGTWGSAQFYVNDNENMHVGGGQLNGPVENLFSNNWLQQNIKTINLDENVQAPQNSDNLFGAASGSNNTTTSTINGLDKLDTSQVTDMDDMFAYDNSLSNLDVSHFDTRNVNNMDDMFYGDNPLSNLDVSHFDTRNVNNMEDMFSDDSSLSNLDVSHFDTRNVNNMEDMFGGDSSLSNLKLGFNTKLDNNASLSGTYKNGNQALSANQLTDNNAHPGTWYRQ